MFVTLDARRHRSARGLLATLGVHGAAVAALIYSLTIAVWHLAPYYDLMMRDHEVHIATHLMFLVTATIMWWPVASQLPEVPRLPYGLGMLYLFLVGIPMQIVAALITVPVLLGFWFIGHLQNFQGSEFLRALFGYLSFAIQFGDFIRGLVRTEAVAFYLIVAAIALTLNAGYLQWRR